jgi:hypothetical protein
MINRLWILLCLLLTRYAVVGQISPRQNEDTSVIADTRLVAAYIKEVDSKVDHLEQKLNRYTVKTLRKVQKQDDVLKRKLAKKDSVKAATVFGNTESRYSQLQQRLQNTKGIKQYIPSFDTLSSSLKFLQQDPQLASITKESGKVKATLVKVNRLGGSMEKAGEIKKFLKERRQYLKDQLQNHGFAKELKRLNKQAYYYNEQLNEYKSLLKDYRKTGRKVIELLGKTNAFQNFMHKNSMLAALFRPAGDPNDLSSFGGTGGGFAGLQTRAQVSTLIQQQAGTTGQAQLQQSMQDAQSQLQQLKNRVSQFGSNSGDGDPDSYRETEGFKPNQQKVKSFMKRLEFGINIQSQRASNFFPISSDIGLSVGYKVNDKSIIGLGASYKMGWGSSWKNINITNQGVGLRSFIEWRLKGSFWVTGGYEQNYKTAFRNIDELHDQNGWQQSGLAGLSKVVSVKTKFFKKAKLQLLWDFLSYQQLPGTQSIIFRIGYGLK